MEADSFGARLLEYRKEHYLTQKKMAELMGISPNHVAVLESGKKHPRPSTEAKFARLSEGDRPLLEVKRPMNEAERRWYQRIRKKLSEMEPERREAGMNLFMDILIWLEQK